MKSTWKRSGYVHGFLVVIAFLMTVPVSLHAQPGAPQRGFHPYISVQGEYNDNINLTATNKKDDYITTVRPGLKYITDDPKAGIDFDYSAGFVFYGKETDKNYVSHSGRLNAKYLTAAHVNFYLKEQFIRSDEPREREYFTLTEENKYVLAQKTERYIYWRNVVSPTIEYQFGPEDRIGVTYRNNIYRTRDPAGERSQEDHINPFIDYWFDRRNGIHLEYGYTIGDFKNSPDLTGHRANVKYTNRFSPRTSAFCEYTYLQRDFDNPGIDYDVHEPSIGITYAFSPVTNASAQIGYFWKKPDRGDKTEGVSYKAHITSRDVRTSYYLSLQGGYTEDFFTAENLGFNRYHRLTGSITHFLVKSTSIGLAGNVEYAEFSPTREEWIWGINGSASYTPLKWLTLSLEISHRERDSNVNAYDYTENRGIIRVTATY